MVEAEVGEPADREPHPAHAPQGQRVAGDLHGDRVDAAFQGGGERRVQVGRLRRGPGAVHDEVAEAGLDGADQSGGTPGCAQPGLDQVRGRRLAGGTRDAEHGQPAGRVAVHPGGGRAEHGAGIGHHERGQPGGRRSPGARRVGEHRDGARVPGGGHELGAVPAGPRQGRVQVAGAHLATRMGDAGHSRIGAAGRCRPDQGRQVAQRRGGDAAGARIAGHGARPYPSGSRPPRHPAVTS